VHPRATTQKRLAERYCRGVSAKLSREGARICWMPLPDTMCSAGGTFGFPRLARCLSCNTQHPVDSKGQGIGVESGKWLTGNG